MLNCDRCIVIFETIYLCAEKWLLFDRNTWNHSDVSWAIIKACLQVYADTFKCHYETCLNEGLLPKCTYFRIHDPAAHDGTDTQKYRNTLANNPWWWPMKGPKALGTISVNTSTNLKPKNLFGNFKGILIKLYR